MMMVVVMVVVGWVLGWWEGLADLGQYVAEGGKVGRRKPRSMPGLGGVARGKGDVDGVTQVDETLDGGVPIGLLGGDDATIEPGEVGQHKVTLGAGEGGSV
jgi:hypothetical protein